MTDNFTRVIATPETHRLVCDPVYTGTRTEVVNLWDNRYQVTACGGYVLVLDLVLGQTQQNALVVSALRTNKGWVEPFTLQLNFKGETKPFVRQHLKIRKTKAAKSLMIFVADMRKQLQDYSVFKPGTVVFADLFSGGPSGKCLVEAEWLILRAVETAIVSSDRD